jgi:hypothetical protein
VYEYSDRSGRDQIKVPARLGYEVLLYLLIDHSLDESPEMLVLCVG